MNKLKNFWNRSWPMIVYVSILILLLFPYNTCNAQDSLVIIDVPLANKLNYMANKARELDTTVYNLEETIEWYQRIIIVGDSIMDNQEDEIATYKAEIDNHKESKTIMIQENEDLRTELDVRNKLLSDCENQHEIKDTKIIKLKASRNESYKANIGMGTILLATLAVVIINATK
jgi:hypothetical protein